MLVAFSSFVPRVLTCRGCSLHAPVNVAHLTADVVFRILFLLTSCSSFGCRGFWRKVKSACRAAGSCVARGLKKGAAWLRSCPGRAVSLIKSVATAALGSSRQ